MHENEGRRAAIRNNIFKLHDLFNKAALMDEATVSVACAEDANVLEAAVAAHEKGIARFVLVGDSEKIAAVAAKCEADISPFEVVHEPDMEQASKKAVALVSDGSAVAVMKGLVDTSVIMKAVLDKDAGMRTGRKLSHLSVFEMPLYHKLLFITDAALNIAPDLQAKKEIIINAVTAATNLGLTDPKVALLAAKEKADPKMPVTVECTELVKLYSAGEIPNCIIDGPFALDNAVSEESARIKGIESPVAGDADILMCPNIESANILYKSLAFLGGGQNGGVVVGAKRPIILTSRADSAESKLISIALGVLF